MIAPRAASSADLRPLDTLRSRTSAAYRGLYVLLQREGACDFFWKARMVDLDLDDVKLDIHHIFPKKWCEENDIPPRRFNAIVNKTAISYKANRMIGGKAPSQYLDQIQSHAQVLLNIPGMDAILKSHAIDPPLLRADSFEAFYGARRSALLALIERATGKTPTAAGPVLADDDDADDEDEEASVEVG